MSNYLFFSFHFEKNKLWATKRKREKISTQIIFIFQSTHTKKKKVVKMSIAALLQAAEYLERRDRGKSCLHLIFSICLIQKIADIILQVNFYSTVHRILNNCHKLVYYKIWIYLICSNLSKTRSLFLFNFKVILLLNWYRAFVKLFIDRHCNINRRTPDSLWKDNQ